PAQEGQTDATPPRDADPQPRRHPQGGPAVLQVEGPPPRGLAVQPGRLHLGRAAHRPPPRREGSERGPSRRGRSALLGPPVPPAEPVVLPPRRAARADPGRA